MTITTKHRALAYLAFALIYAYFKDYTMFDDGLRHIAFAAHQSVMKNWGEVYPHSLFGLYDPWFVWHKILEFALRILPYAKLHIVINAFFLFFVSLWCDLAITKFVQKGLGALTALAAITIAYLSIRYLNARPDNLSGLYSMYAILLPNGFFASFALTLIYAPTYYLFYFYTGIVGLMWLLTKNYRSFAGVFAASVLGIFVHLWIGGEEFVKISSYLLNDQKLREGLNVGELTAYFKPLELLPNTLNSAVLVAASAWGVIWLERKKPQPFIVYFLLLSSFMWLQAVRYFELFYPITLVTLLYAFAVADFGYISKRICKAYEYTKQALLSAKDSLFFLIASVVMVIVGYSVQTAPNESKKLLEGYSFLKEERFDGKTVLSNAMTNMQYFGLYQNQMLHFIPSCSIGWFDKSDLKMRDIYIRMQKEAGVSEEEIAALARYVNADYYVHYLRNFEQKMEFEKLKRLGIEPVEIRANLIIFRVSK